MYEKFDSTYQVLSVDSHLTPHTSRITPHTSHLTPHTSHLTPHTSHISQATIGIDFLSKTMYLEDRTVRLQVRCITTGLGFIFAQKPTSRQIRLTPPRDAAKVNHFTVMGHCWSGAF